MSARREVRCEDCGTLNRVRSYSFRQIPNCGKCHKPLPERPLILGLRDLYRSRKAIATFGRAGNIAIGLHRLRFHFAPINSAVELRGAPD